MVHTGAGTGRRAYCYYAGRVKKLCQAKPSKSGLCSPGARHTARRRPGSSLQPPHAKREQRSRLRAGSVAAPERCSRDTTSLSHGLATGLAVGGTSWAALGILREQARSTLPPQSSGELLHASLLAPPPSSPQAIEERALLDASARARVACACPAAAAGRPAPPGARYEFCMTGSAHTQSLGSLLPTQDASLSTPLLPVPSASRSTSVGLCFFNGGDVDPAPPVGRSSSPRWPLVTVHEPSEL